MKLYVRNLPPGAAESDLESLFSTCGTVLACVVLRDNRTGQSRRFGFVTMGDATDGKRAVQTLHGSEYGGRQLEVSEATER